VTKPDRVLLVFLDGVGIGEDDAEVNPFIKARASLPTLNALMGGNTPTLSAPRGIGPGGVTMPLDAPLDVEGLPQSGTGQTALLTGEGAAELHGRHFGPWVPVALRPLVEERSVLRRALEAGRSAAFANAYPRAWPGSGRRSRFIAAPPLAAKAAGLLDRHEKSLGEGRAISSEIVNDGWRTHLGHHWLPEITPQQAGANLAAISSQNDLTLYAHYSTDGAGHEQSIARAVSALQLVDAFFEGVLSELSPGTLLLVTSDHGNIEDVRAGHTRNPALGIAAGPGAEHAAGLSDLREVTPFILGMLGVDH
jgi:2,3-bisphosphoglycerate-independent phosphoglycerate mutase